MADKASFVSAIAAALAAVLAALNIYYSGQRERERWARDVLVDVLVTFLDSSFDSSRAVRDHLEGAAADDAPDWVARVETAHRQKMAALTKIRLLAPGRAVDAAVGLHEADYRFARLGSAHPIPTAAKISLVHEEVWAARRQFIAASQRTVRLRYRDAPTRSLTGMRSQGLFRRR
ncbi:hypothetical protein AB0B94_18635 [Micromonospora sp. NPDC048986]|uniref:hypothetical protein n=1 Tax=Micromonospora sp. NPDC048986 TaxID=3155644 RepID=UPI003408CAEE